MNTSNIHVDIAVIGAGIAGLVCAQQLQQTGYRVVVLEKSRGVGGRVATRRLPTTCADHGLRYFEKQGPLSQAWLSKLVQQGFIVPWEYPIRRLGVPGSPSADEILHQRVNQPISRRYCAPAGATAAAKFLATGLEIQRGQRVLAVAPSENGWRFTLESISPDTAMLPLTASAVVIAIPAPQAEVLLRPLTQHGLPADLLTAVAAVEFDPCITVIATYSPTKLNSNTLLSGWELAPADEAAIAWIGLETSKRPAESPVVVVQSTAEFARTYLDSLDLNAVGEQLLEQAAAIALSWLNQPDQFQVHRWRYARVRYPCPHPYLLTPLPRLLVCCGDWCGGYQVEAALQSGIAAAHALHAQISGMAAPSHLEQIIHFEQLLTALA